MSISGANTWFTLNDKPLDFSNTSENLDANAFECNSLKKKGNILKVTSVAPSPDTIDIFTGGERIPTAYAGVWEWRPPLGFAGLHELHIKVAGLPTQIARVRVLPEKLSQDRYEIMLSNLSNIAVDLLIRLNSQATEGTQLQIRENIASPLRDYFLIRKLMSDLEDAIFHIRRNPYRLLRERTEQLPLHEIRNFSSDIVPIPESTVTVSKQVAQISNTNILPEFWIVRQNQLTYDVYENRLLKHFLRTQLISKLYFIKEQAINELARLEKDYTIADLRHWEGTKNSLGEEIKKLKPVIKDCEQMMRRCISWAGESFLKQVTSSDISGKATQMLLKNPFYYRFFQLYLQFKKELTISLDIQRFLTSIAMQKVSELYEIWSVFTITKIVLEEHLNAGYQIESDTLFFEIEQNHFQFKISKNVASIVLTKDAIRVEIKYEPIYQSINNPALTNISTLGAILAKPLDQRTPDLVIEVYEHSQPRDVIVFDVKYRWQGTPGSHEANEDDKDKMRAYRDIICYRTYDSSNNVVIKQLVSNAYILYPGDILWQEPYNKLGALPLVPGMDAHQYAKTKNIIRSLLQSSKLL